MTRRALVVDDDRAMVKTLSDVLSFKGWQVTAAYSGTEAVEAAAREPFDVVLLDVKMPGMDGVEAFKAIKSRQPGVKVLLMTAYAAEDRLAEAQREGIARILPKPVNLPALLELMSGPLRQAHPILLIDNDATFLKTLSEVLRLHGFATVIADSLEHATDVLAAEQPVAVLLHMHLGAVPAEKAIAVVHDRCPAVALILYSGQADAEQEVRALVPPEWIYMYLQKPFALEQVTGALDAICHGG